jgi:hypothetical protein
MHQLIREEFPTLKCVGRNDGAFMQVEVLDHEKEAKVGISGVQAQFSRIFLTYRSIRPRSLLNTTTRSPSKRVCMLPHWDNTLFSQITGLTWIFEALVGGDLSGIQPEWFASNSSDKPEDQLPYIKVELAQIIATLQKKKHILVGHNIFTDLAFLYKTFIGNLPATVKNFQAEIHELFPTVFDTKYLATHNNSSMNPRVNLKQLLAPFRKVHVPLIVLHEQHTAYGASLGKEHEAGFDSWMTAELFVKLSAQLYITFKASRSIETMRQLACISDTDSYDEATGYYSDDDDDSPDGGAPLDLRSVTPSPKKTDPRLGALDDGYFGVEPFFPTSFQAQSKTRLAVSSQSQTNSNIYSGSSSTIPNLSFNSQGGYLGTFHSGDFKNGSLSALSRGSYSTIATGTSVSGGGAPINAHDYLGSTIIRAPVLWQVAASKRASLTPGQGPTYLAPITMQDNLPPSYHARQLNGSAITLQDNDAEAEAAQQEAVVQQWIPHFNHPFWGLYVNKLRVNAVEGGVCQLA